MFCKSSQKPWSQLCIRIVSTLRFALGSMDLEAHQWYNNSFTLSTIFLIHELKLCDGHIYNFVLIGSFSGSNRPPWKRVRYSDFVEKPRLLISVLGEKKRQMDELKENLQSTIQKLVRKVCNGLIFSCIKAVSFIREGS